MDFGVGLDGLVGSGTTTNCSSGFGSVASSTPETKLKWYGSGLLKQGRPATAEDNWRSPKLSKTDSMPLPQRSGTLLKSDTILFPDGLQQQQQMLSFSCNKPAHSVERSTHSASLPYFHLISPATSKNTGYTSGSFNVPSLHGAFFDTRGPFTPSQWMELEHQALIYKHIAANVPIPSNLLIPIKHALDSAGISSFSGGLLRPVPWGTFNFGFSGNGDPEPGRCRRTDGKKWRCSKDAVPDQKYCERHMNRGRHRSRKPVEGQSGHSAAVTSAKMSAVSSSASASVVRPLGGGTPISLTIAQNHQQLNNLQQPVDTSTNLSANFLGRMILDKENLIDRSQDSPNLSMLSSNIDLKTKEIAFMISKQHNSNVDSPRTEFGLVTSDSLMNPSHTSSSLMRCTNFSSTHDLTDQESLSQQSLRQFMDDWPKAQSDRSAVSLSGLDTKSDKIQLSISTPAALTDFMSSTSSPVKEKPTVSPLRLSREMDQMPTGQGVCSSIHEFNQKQTNWIPISWERSVGGPLGEVLHSTNSSAGEGVTEGWENSPRLGSSPTGVLQKTLFGSLSNSSTGSSPRAENAKTREGASLCNDLLGSALVHSASLPAL